MTYQNIFDNIKHGLYSTKKNPLWTRNSSSRKHVTERNFYEDCLNYGFGRVEDKKKVTRAFEMAQDIANGGPFLNTSRISSTS